MTRRMIKGVTKGTKAPPVKLTEVTYNYIKSRSFRVIHVDGAWGGFSPQGRIQMAVYSERPAIPQITVNRVEPDGKLGAELRREGKHGVVREVEANLVMDEQTAKAVYDWLGERLKILEQAKTGNANA